ncbi:MAG: ABC transporter substrate-binding protein [Candidatus Aminicenantaceae bacterium]
MKRIVINSLIIFFALGITAQENQDKITKDDLGNPYVYSSPPQKIISLAPNITEILFALELGEQIVGVTRYCDYPSQALAKERIGGMIDPNLELIKSLNPDLVIGFRGNPLKHLMRLKELRVPVFILGMGSNIESVYSIIRKIGKITRREREADDLVRSMKSKYVKIQSVLSSVIHRPKVFLSLHGKGLWTCGRESFLNDLLTKAKGINIAGTIPRRWLSYNREQLIHENPEIIIILAKSEEEFIQAKEWIEEGSYLTSIRAVREGRIYFLDENLATRPGPRIIEAFAQLVSLLHPQIFNQLR